MGFVRVYHFTAAAAVVAQAAWMEYHEQQQSQSNVERRARFIQCCRKLLAE